MDIISLNEAATANSRIEICNANPDSTSGIVTVPKVIASGETITIPAGRIAILPNVQIDGVLNVENGGEVFIPSGSTLSTVVEKVISTDNAIVRFNGTTGAVQNSSVTIDDNGNIGIGTNGVGMILSDNNWGMLLKADSQGGIADVALMDAAGVARFIIDPNGYSLHISPTGLGYGTGSGGTVTQLTSKSTNVTLNKPSGTITTSNSALASLATVKFYLSNSLISANDNIIVTLVSGDANVGLNYKVWVGYINTGVVAINVQNTSVASRSEALGLKFDVIKGANS